MKPGRLTSAYLEGRRVRFVAPLRLFLMASVVLGAAMVFSEGSLVLTFQGAEPDPNDWLRLWLWSVLLAMPVFAALLALVTRRRGRFVEHLVFAMHFHAFAFLARALMFVVLELSIADWVSVAALALIPLGTLVYLLLAMRHQYELSWLRATLSALAVGSVYVVIELLALVVSGLIAAQLA